ncbi:MAG: membrane protein insertase YidC [Mariprofundaceae bacterium]|nr:membrane protein insertase YidC [Mariprofundaceae bacterium]
MEQRNLLLAVVLSVGILWLWSALFPAPETPTDGRDKPAVIENTAKDIAVTKGGMPELRPATEDVGSAVIRTPDVSSGGEIPATHHQRYSIENNLLRLTMDERGWLTDAELLQYTESIEPGAGNVHVLNQQQLEGSVEFRSNYINTGVLGARIQTPFARVKTNSAGNEAHFQATLDNGLIWQRTLRMTEGSYLVQIEDRIKDGAGMKMFRQVVQRNPDKKLNTFYEHIGPTGFLNDTLQKVDYDDLDEGKPVQMAAIGGWTAMMNRYFITAIVGDPDRSYRYFYKGDGRSYQAGLLDDGQVENGDALFHSTLFIGPKSIPLLETMNIKLERCVDFGWFAFIAKPMHQFMLWLFDYVHNFGWAIIILVLTIKIIFFYPTHKAYESMASMRKLQPELVRLKDLHGSDRQRMSQEMMALYKKNKVNPLGGCLPIVIQIPVFFSLYKVLLMSIEMRQAPFELWIHDLSVQDPYFILPVVMGASMYIQQRLNPQPTDPVQAKVLQFLPPVFTVMFLFFPSGLVLYWVVNNVLSIGQQWYVLKLKKAL